MGSYRLGGQSLFGLWPHLFSRTAVTALMAIVLLFTAAPYLLPPVFAAGPGGGAIDWWTMGMTLFGGLALFLYGMEQMADALKAVAGERMKNILEKLTSNRFLGAITGAFVTAVIQSSSVTTVLVVGFITAGLMSMAQSIGVIMGANIGTTITAQIIAFKVTKLALLMVAVGFGMLFFSKNDKPKQYGAMVMGLGLIFFGMSVMSNAMHPLRSYQPFLDLMATMSNPIIGILVAAAFTGLIQSSSATTGIIIVMAGQGFISLPAGIALIFGANIGTCVTAALAAIGKPREAVRAALVHILFNILGVLIWLPFIDQLAQFVTWISPAYPDLGAIDRLAAETPRQIANAHTTFNIANTFLFIGFTSQFARMVEWLVPDKPLEEEEAVHIVRAKYLEEELLATPSLALDRVRLEVLHMSDLVQDMLKTVIPAVLGGDHESLRQIQRMDDQVDLLQAHILDYMGKISKTSLTDEQTKDFMKLMAAVNDLENIGDIMETNLYALGSRRIEEGVVVSDATRKVIEDFHKQVKHAVDLAVHAVSQYNPRVAQEVILMKSEINRLENSAALHEAKRLVAEEPNRIAAYTFEMDVIENLKRIYYFAKRMAKTVVPDELLTKEG